jgi:hypothetical protein
MSLTRSPRSGVTPQAAQPAPPSRLYSFTGWQASNPTAPPPGDRMDADYDNTNTALTQTLSWAATSLNTDGTLKAGSVGQSQMVSGLFDDIAQDIIDEVQPLVDQAQGYAASAAGSSTTAQAASAAADASNTAAQGAATTATAAATTAITARDTAQGYATTAQTAATQAQNADNDAQGAAALAQDYADVTQAWAEHMPDTIPPNILAVMNVTGDHWSARWWANNAAQIVADAMVGFVQFGNVVVDLNVDPAGAFNQSAAVTRSTLAGAGAGPRLNMANSGFNTFYGYFTGNMMVGNAFSAPTSAENTFLGYAAGMNQPSGSYNTYVGNGAGWGINYDSSYSTFVGMDVFRGAGEFGNYNAGTFNVGVGSQCFRNGTFNQNVAMGTGAMRFTNNTATTVTCNDNVAIGYSAMSGDGTCLGTLNFNVAVGWGSGGSLGVGQSGVVQANTLLGHNSGGNLKFGSFDTFVGYNSGGSPNIGTVNFLTLIGAQTGENLTTATQVTAAGFQAGRNLTSGNANDLFGYQAGLGLTTGSRNVVLGGSNATNLVNGTLNTIVGPLTAGKNLVSGNNNILIGYALDTVNANDGGTINIGNAYMATLAGGPAAQAHIILAGLDVAYSNMLVSTNAAGPTISVPFQLVTAIAPAAGGTGYAVNDTLHDATGGRYNVTSVSAGAVTALSIYKPGISAAPPGNPVTLTTGSKTTSSNQLGSGCTATLTWSANNRLTLQSGGLPTLIGGNVGFNNSAPIGKPAITGAKGSNAALASLLSALVSYGLITDSTTA